MIANSVNRGRIRYRKDGGSEEFKLQTRCGWCFLLFPIEEFDVCKLFVRYSQNTNMSILRDGCLNATDVYAHVLSAGAMPDVDGELEHGEAIAHDVFTEFGRSLTFLLGICGEVKENEDPHDSVLTETRC